MKRKSILIWTSDALERKSCQTQLIGDMIENTSLTYSRFAVKENDRWLVRQCFEGGRASANAGCSNLPSVRFASDEASRGQSSSYSGNSLELEIDSRECGHGLDHIGSG